MFLRHVLILSLCALAASASDPAEILSRFGEVIGSFGTGCLSRNGVQISPQLLAPEGAIRAGKYLVACTLQLLDLVDDKGNLNGDAILQKMPADAPGRTQLQKIIADCSGKGGGDAGQGTVNTIKCLVHEQLIRNGFGKMLKKIGSMSKMFFG